MKRPSNVNVKFLCIFNPFFSGIFWTSGNDLAESNKFSWMSIGQQFTYMNFNKIDLKEENVRSENEMISCVAVNYKKSSAHWTVEDCAKEAKFICKKPPSYTLELLPVPRCSDNIILFQK